MTEAITKQTTWLNPQNLEEGLKLAEMISKANLVPDHLKKSPGDCLLVLAQAAQWGMNPLAVAQCTAVVHGRLCYEGKLVHAALLAMDAIQAGSEEFTYFGNEGSPERGITLKAKLRSGQERTVKGTVKQWRTFGRKKDGSKFDNAWDHQPDDMLLYRAWRQWARRHAPAAMMGISTPDEIDVEARVVEVADPTVFEGFQKNMQRDGLWSLMSEEEQDEAQRMSYADLQQLAADLRKRKDQAPPPPKPEPPTHESKIPAGGIEEPFV